MSVQARKAGQAYRREFKKRFNEQMDFLKLFIKPRPRFFPRWLWRLGLSLYIRETLEKEI